MFGDIAVSKLSNCAVYIDGDSFLGRASEVELPHPKHKTIEHKGLGMAGSLKLWAGIDGLEATIKWTSFDADALTITADGMTSHALQCRGNIQVSTSQGLMAEVPAVYLLTGVFDDAGKAPFKHQENVEIQSHMNVYKSELLVAGVQVFLYDVFANIYQVGGNDMLANFRANLGMV